VAKTLNYEQELFPEFKVFEVVTCVNEVQRLSQAILAISHPSVSHLCRRVSYESCRAVIISLLCPTLVCQKCWQNALQVAAFSMCKVPERLRLPSLSTQLEWNVLFKKLYMCLKTNVPVTQRNKDEKEKNVSQIKR